MFEIGVEELPARFVPGALSAMSGLARGVLEAAGLAFHSVQTLGTPRRLALLVNGLSDSSRERVQEFLGPPVAQSKDAEGNWTPAAQGFARSQGTTPEKLEARATEKGERLCAVKKEAGSAAAAMLPDLLAGLVRKIPFPKNMVWEESRFSFARPIRWLVALYGARVVKLEIAGVKSGRKTVGLRTQEAKPFDVSEVEDYVKILRNKCVIVDPAERRSLVEKQIAQTLRSEQGHVPLSDHVALLDEVVHLVEYPVAILGKFDERYLELPQEILVTSMKKHQKFFPVFQSSPSPLAGEGRGEGFRLLPNFIGIRNGMSVDQAVVREGYERVLAARLSDAAFFFERDRKRPLEEFVENLQGLALFPPLTVKNKTHRVEKMTAHLAENFAASAAAEAARIARLSKADLVTAMVGEFPELQGVMGRIYASFSESPGVAQGVEQHYWPLTADGKLPEAEASALVSVADKLDTLAGNFMLGNAPTGSKDPYGLRRAAVGVLRILQERKWHASLRGLCWKSMQSFEFWNEAKHAGAFDPLMDFLAQRWAALMEAKGFRFDEVQAVLHRFDDPADAERRLEALAEVRRHPDFTPLSVAFKRADNILSQARKRGIVFSSDVSENSLREDAEKGLLGDLKAVEEGMPPLLAERRYGDGLRRLVALRGGVDRFFESVMVMAPEEDLRANRLALLARITSLFRQIADLAALQDVPGARSAPPKSSL